MERDGFDEFHQRDKKDFKIEWFSGTGAGGQYRNKHQNSARVTHLPTGITETSQCRSRENSLNEAMSKINQRLDHMGKSAFYNDIAIDRKSKVGSGQRGDKIRTYRFQDDTVTDHISGKKANLNKVMQGYFDLL